MIALCAPEVNYTWESSVSSLVLSDKLGHAKAPQEQEAVNRCQIDSKRCGGWRHWDKFVQVKWPGGERFLAMRSPKNPLKQLIQRRMSFRHLPVPENGMPAYDGTSKNFIIPFSFSFLASLYLRRSAAVGRKPDSYPAQDHGSETRLSPGREDDTLNQIWNIDYSKGLGSPVFKLKLFYDLNWLWLPTSEQRGPGTCPSSHLEQEKATSHWQIFKRVEGEVLFWSRSAVVLIQHTGCSASAWMKQWVRADALCVAR